MSHSLAVMLTAGTAAALALPGQAAAQTIDWLAPVNGSWDTPGNWLGGTTPDTPGENARFALGGVYIVTLPSAKTIGDLLALDAITLNVNNGVNLTAANATNNGTITVNPSAGGSATQLIIGNGGVVSGSGRITLNASSGVLARAQLYSGPANTWTHAAGHTIGGRGQVYYAFTNLGVVTADNAGDTLQLLNGAVANQGSLRAQGGTLNLSAESVSQSGGGGILATGAGSAVTLSGSSISGGTIAATAGGQIASVGGVQTLTGVTASGPFNINDSTAILADGVFTNLGTITVNTQAGGSATSLRVAAGATLGGTGRVTLNASSGVLDRAQLYCPTQQSWTHAAGHTIGGRGNIYYALDNRGTITADNAGDTLQMRDGTVLNSGLITASGGVLALTTETIQQNGGVISAAGGPVRLSGATVQGGTMTSSGANHIASVQGGQVLDGVTLQGNLDINDGTSVSCPAGLSHQGLVLVNTTAGGSTTSFQIGAGSTLGGPGTLTLNASSGVLDRAQLYSPSTHAWSHAAGHTVNGRGSVYYDVANAGLFTADTLGETLILRNGTITNTGTLRADNGGFLTLASETVSQSGAGLISAAGGEVRLQAATITGGALASGPGRRILSQSGAQTLGNVTNTAVFDIADSTSVTIASTITESGTLTVNSNAGGSATSLQVADGQSILGSGTIVLNGSSGVLDRAYINTISGAWTHGPAHTIRGRGRVYGAWTNAGLTVADAANETLELLNGAMANSGTLRAAAGFLTLTGETVAQSGPGVIHAAGPGSVRLNTATISGGRLTGPGSFVTTSGSSTLTGGVIVEAPLSINDNTAVVAPTGLTNNGSMTVNAQGGGSATVLRAGADTTIGGTGTITLNATSGVLDRAYLHAPSGTLTLGHGQTLAGTGRVYAAWTSHGDLHPSGPSRLIDLQAGPYTQADDGSLTIDLAGPATYGRISGPTLKTLGGTLRITLQNGFMPLPCNDFTIITGPTAGRFSALDLPAVPLGRLSVLYNPGSVVVRYIPADFNGDGFPDFFDYDDFVQCFETGICPEGATADFNNDGFIDFFDYDAFVEAFELGC